MVTYSISFLLSGSFYFDGSLEKEGSIHPLCSPCALLWYNPSASPTCSNINIAVRDQVDL